MLVNSYWKKNSMNYNKFKFRELIFESFFSGKVHAKGHLIQYFPKKKKKNLLIDFEGKYTNNELYIKESYYEEEASFIRHWKFKKIRSNSFIGNEKNVCGEIKVDINGNCLHMNYLFKILFKRVPVNLKVKDNMFLISENNLINTSVVSKYNIKLAETLLLYKKLL